MVADRKIDDETLSASDAATRNAKGGRKPLPKTAKRGVRKEIGYQPGEWAKIERDAKSVGMTTTDFIRSRSLGFTPKTSPAPDLAIVIAELNRIILEFGRVGNNVNQLTKSVHLDTGFQQYWREVGQEVKTLTSAAHSALARLLAK